MLGLYPIPGQQFVEFRGWMIGDAAEHVGEPSLRIDVIQLGGLDQREHRGGAASTGIGAGEQPVLAADRNRPVILPMSGRRSRSIIAGTHIMGDAFVANMSSGAPAVMSFTSR